MLSLCLMEMLTEEAIARLSPYESKYMFDGEIYGPLLYKVIMRLATIDSVATTEALRSNLRELPAYTATVNGDLPKVHTYFHQNYSQLIAHGASIDDPVGILFDAYQAIPCSGFRAYITRKHDQFLDGELKNLTHETLMAAANDKYTYLVNKGLWKSTSKDDYVAMSAKLEKLKGQLKLAPKLVQKAAESGKKSAGGKSNKQGAGGGKKQVKTKNKKNNRDRRAQALDEELKKKAPSAGEPNTKTSNGKTYHWCHHHMAWTIHQPSDCRLGLEHTSASTSNTRMVANNATLTSNANDTSHQSYAAAIIANMARCAADE